MNKQIYTLSELLDEYEINIPIIQRDYAHGRDNPKALEIRTWLVKELWGCMLDKNKSLHLDFIYGAKNSNCLIPYDGQQRLTTLFLFHRYLYEKFPADQEKHYKVLSRFSYEIRSSARDFCKELCKVNNSIFNEIDSKLTIDILDQPWFDVSWLHDPTVSGMITVLKEIENQDVNLQLQVLDSLSHITFSLVDMGQIKISDLSYISMNSKGRPLTALENFKASLLANRKQDEPDGRYNWLSNHIISSFDTTWRDCFFKRSRGKYDSIMFGMIHLHLSNIERIYNRKKNSFKLSLFKNIEQIPYTPFEDYDDILRQHKDSLLGLFNLWSFLAKPHKADNDDDIDECTLNNVCTPSWAKNPSSATEANTFIYFGLRFNNIDFKTRLIFYALVIFFYRSPGAHSKELLSAWIRIILNVVENANVNQDSFSKHLSLVTHMALRWLKTANTQDKLWTNMQNHKSYFSKICKDQIEEEIEKAEALRNSPQVVDIATIINAEKDEWCKGKISILFDNITGKHIIQNNIINENLDLLNRFRNNLGSDKRSSFLIRLFSIMCVKKDLLYLWNNRIAFPLKDQAVLWKKEIYKWKKLFLDNWFIRNCKEIEVAEPLPLNSSQYHVVESALRSSYHFVFNGYACLWNKDGFRIQSQEGCYRQNCYYMDAYFELCLLSCEPKNNDETSKCTLGWRSRDIYDIKDEHGIYNIDYKINNETLAHKEISVQSLKECEGRSLEEKLRKLFANEPLLNAVQKGHDENCIRCLLDYGMDPNAIDEQGRTALMLAAAKDCTKVCRLLVERGANVNAVSSENMTPLSYAERVQNADIMRMLKEAGAKESKTA